MVRQEVADRLRNAIRRGQFVAGQRLIERELCDSMGVSRTSVREALRQLESEGLVEIVPRRGPAISTISAREIAEIYDVRMALEARMVERFVTEASDSQVADLVHAVATFAAATGKDDAAKISDAKSRLFSILMAGCGNDSLARIVDALHARLILSRSEYLHEPARLGRTAVELQALADAIRARDAAAAEAAMLRAARAQRGAAKASR